MNWHPHQAGNLFLVDAQILKMDLPSLVNAPFKKRILIVFSLLQLYLGRVAIELLTRQNPSVSFP